MNSGVECRMQVVYHKIAYPLITARRRMRRRLTATLPAVHKTHSCVSRHLSVDLGFIADVAPEILRNAK